VEETKNERSGGGEYASMIKHGGRIVNLMVKAADGFLEVLKFPHPRPLSRGERGEEMSRGFIALPSPLIDQLYKNEPRFFSPLPPGEGAGVREGSVGLGANIEFYTFPIAPPYPYGKIWAQSQKINLT
jgi:hypothetical protein